MTKLVGKLKYKWEIQQNKDLVYGSWPIYILENCDNTKFSIYILSVCAFTPNLYGRVGASVVSREATEKF